MNEPTKTVTDSEFAEGVLSDHAQLQAHDKLTAAERATLRELIGFMDVLRPIVEDYRFSKAAWTKVGGVRETVRAWAFAITAIGGVLTLIYTTYRNFGG